MRIALVKCPRRSSGLFRENSESLALGYLAASLRAAGHDVDILNAALREIPEEQLLERLQANDYSIIGFNIADPTLIRPTERMVESLRTAGSGAFICAGGHSATFHCREILDRSAGIDAVALFEGESTVVELAEAQTLGNDWRQVPGLAFREEGRPVKGSPRPMSSDLDPLPFPARDDLDWVLEHLPERGAVPVLASRGCYFNCSFCSVRAFYEQNKRATWRRRSVANVLDEIGELLERDGVTDILLVDDLFVSKSRRTLEYARDFAREILARGYRFTFTISATVDSVELDTFRLLREAGLRQVFVGAESASPDILKYLGKWFAPEETARCIGVLDELGLDASVSFINFTPASRLHHLRENVEFFQELGVNLLQGLLNRYQVYGGTPLFSLLENEERLTGSFPTFDYVDEDPLVAMAYEICKESLGSLLQVHYAFKQVERRSAQHRSRAFHEGTSTTSIDAASGDEIGFILKDMRRGLSADVGDLFERVLDFVEAQGAQSNPQEPPPAFVRDMKQAAQATSKEWLRTLSLLDNSLLMDPDESPVEEVA